MDSVTDKQSYLSMTGIDQTEENTESITVLNAQIADFVKNVIPFIILKSTDQPIVGIKTFLQPIGTCGFEPLVMLENNSRLHSTRTANTSLFLTLPMAFKLTAR